MPKVTENVDVLRQGWLDAASSAAPDLAVLRESLESELEAVQSHGDLTEQTLLGAIDEAMRRSGHELPPDVGPALVRRLQRTVYEYLLSLDAVLPQESAAWSPSQLPPPEGSVMIGAEEVAALTAPQMTPLQQPEPEPELEPEPEPQAEPEPVPEPDPEPEPEPVPVPEAQAAPQPEPEPEQLQVQAEAQARPEAGPAAAPEPPGADPETKPGHAPGVAEPAAEPAPGSVPERGGRRFAIFGRSTGRAPQRPTSAERAETQPAETPQAAAASQSVESPQAAAPPQGVETPQAAAPAAAPQPPRYVPPPATDPVPAAPAPAPASAPAARPDDSFTPLPSNRGLPGEPFIAPREGFHISEDAAPLVISTPSDLGIDTTPEPASTAGWSVREDHPSTGRRPQPAADAAEAAAEEARASIRQPGDEPALLSDAVIETRHRIEERLSKRRCDEAAALVQKLAQDPGGRGVAELALDAGDRCRALGKNNSALSCYLAATRADPVFDQPLLRLADICIDDHDIDLAVAYLERVARFYRLGGGTREAIRIFRKIATIAPYRDDILGMLVRVQSTGRFDD